MSNHCIAWNKQESYYNSMCLILLVPTFSCHVLFWIQVCTYKSLRHPSLLWLYNYLILDMVSLSQIFLEYFTRHYKICGLNPVIYDFLCVLEAYANNYTTMVQSFALTLTNIYSVIPQYSEIPLIIFILQYIFSATILVEVVGLSCDLDFSDFFNEFIDIFFLVVLPICINIPVIMLIIRHVRSSQNAVRSVRRIHRHLIIQFIILYSIWFLFFLPQVIFLLSVASSASQRLITKILDIAATLSDVLVITLFDRRFVDAWKLTAQQILRLMKRNNRRINPTTITQPIQLARIQPDATKAQTRVVNVM
ncbi:unnamed protein product [Adineta steineri]|uniref:G-protein coupled receptors family 1 profile domain-containing protein n=2 Tax=Adineta steineri TaxID=433720 RepID=A0A813ZHU6_9BILA|nr:unnamed protein product [Adineta steineri]CAF3552092.1 unnamed protein product [Adineta steineri]